jgi:hypothetical protein
LDPKSNISLFENGQVYKTRLKFPAALEALASGRTCGECARFCGSRRYFMEKEISVNRLFKLVKCFMCVLFLSLLAINPVSAVLDCDNPKEVDKLICQIRMHLPEPQDDPRLEELRGLPTTKWCTHCHAEKNSNP